MASSTGGVSIQLYYSLYTLQHRGQESAGISTYDDTNLQKFKGTEFGKPPQKLPRSPGHWKEWLDACRGGKPAGSNFADHAAHLAEVVLLGNIAIRMNQKLEWDTVNMKFPNCPEADRFVNLSYRDGFAL